MDPGQTEFQFWRVPCKGGIELQLLYDVRIELVVGYFPYPSMIRIPGSVMDKTGNYLDSQFVSPVWMWGKIPLGIPNFFPMEGVHQTKPNRGAYFHKVSWGYDKKCGFFTNGQFFKVSRFLTQTLEIMMQLTKCFISLTMKLFFQLKIFRYNN